MDPFDLRQWESFTSSGGDISSPATIDQIVIDSRRIHSTTPLFVALEGKTTDGHNFILDALSAGARFVLAKKGWNPGFKHPNGTILRVDSPLTSLQEIAKAYRLSMPCQVVAIAGSFGKTMVKDLLVEILSGSFEITSSPESFNSQIGVPLSLFTICRHHKIAFIEAGISNPGEMKILSDMIQPDHAIITPIGKKHLNTLGNLTCAAEEMIKIASSLQRKAWILIPETIRHTTFSNIDADNIHIWSEPVPSLPFAEFTSDESGCKLPYKISFPDGSHFYGATGSGFYYFIDLVNICAKASWLLGADTQAICSAFEGYIPEPMRIEIWKAPIGATFINEPYCSDPQSVDTALSLLHHTAGKNRKIFLFGGLRESRDRHGIDYRRIGKAVASKNVDRLILYGDQPFGPLVDEILSSKPGVGTTVFPTYADALAQLKREIAREDVVMIKGPSKQPIDEITKTFNDSVSSNQCMINLAAIAQNIHTIRSKLPLNTRLMVMVKALAYGTDEVRVSKFLEACGVDILGVSYVDEGVALKRAGLSQAIFSINAAPFEAEKVVMWDLEIGVSGRSLVDALADEAERQKKSVKVHLHIDTGMGRFGCRMEDALELARYIKTFRHLSLEGIMTHFACAEDPAHDAFTLEQAARFDNAIGILEANGISPRWRHAANSSAMARFSFPQYNMARIGLGVYGLTPSPAVADAIDLRLAISLVTRLVGINICNKGETISYGRTYTIENDRQRIGVLPIGYFDGLHRNYSGKGSVMIRGLRAPMVGKICMDFMMIDLTHIPHASIGDPVLIFGEDEFGNYLSAEELAARGGSIVHELITCLGPRIHRIFVHEEAHRAH